MEMGKGEDAMVLGIGFFAGQSSLGRGGEGGGLVPHARKRKDH